MSVSIHLCIHLLFCTELSNTYFVPSTGSGPGDSVLNGTDLGPTLREMDNKR